MQLRSDSVEGARQGSSHNGLGQHRIHYPRRSHGLVGQASRQGTGIVAPDFDERPEIDESGLRTLHDWEKSNGELPETLTAITGSGGMHYLYRTDKHIAKSEDKTEDKRVGIDIRADGSYIVAPPSIHPNGKRMIGYSRSSSTFSASPRRTRNGRPARARAAR